MKKILALMKRYRFFLVFLAFNLILLFFAPQTGIQAFKITGDNLLEMISILPPIFILLGLLDVWVQRETMMKYMGDGSGIKGGVIAFIMGSAAAGPLYAAFPVAGILLKKGVRLINVFIFIGAWATTKIPLILFETSNLGFEFMAIRLACNIIGIILIAFILEKSTTKQERAAVYEMAKNL
ncbi:MAG: permease [Christensenellales bacterium]